MGICASSQHSTTKGGNSSRPPPTTKIIHPNGKLQEFRQPIKASLLLSQNPECFLCDSELMYVNLRLPRVPEDEQLRSDRFYFLLPLSESQATLSLQELCSLAVKASESLSHLNTVYSSQRHHFMLARVQNLDIELTFNV
ncbi:putative Transcriptional regulator SUPERMAN [Hibiscus syriacus]|uniref:Transcriptional regulator SUPERMAN n=1 Tax=Hibiscus syriacus TaxID=106335 RepID=A0A6A2ZL21_HIBSY|nr:uncharacterized protein LOC120142787 [Hibiscus syriacus]KAE8692608.1 putative Transcriptional regulator SUPERMAN [Hibiscus syriacus]